MKDNQIFFNIKDGQVKLSMKHKDMNIADFLTVISTGILSAMRSIVIATPEENKRAVEEELYDMYNAAASNTLHYFAPEIDMRPHLTAQAIMDAENKIIDKEYQRSKKDPNYKSPIAQTSTPHDPAPKLKVIK